MPETQTHMLAEAGRSASLGGSAAPDALVPAEKLWQSTQLNNSWHEPRVKRTVNHLLLTTATCQSQENSVSRTPSRHTLQSEKRSMQHGPGDGDRLPPAWRRPQAVNSRSIVCDWVSVYPIAFYNEALSKICSRAFSNCTTQGVQFPRACYAG